jgi:hypothetical protein
MRIDYAELEAAIGLNWYEIDPDLQDIVRTHCPPDRYESAHGTLIELGALLGGGVAARAEVTDRNSPRLQRYDRWGNDTGRVEHHPGALQTKRDLFNARLFREDQNPPAVVGSASSYMLNQSETGMACAVGMTGGVATLVDAFGSQAVKDYLLPHLRPKSYDDLWDGAMFLTERDGGSDLGGATQTRATHVDGDLWLLNGFKWFCSNVDADVISTLARPAGAPDGVGGISLFVVPRVRRDGTPNGVVVHRLKDKLGTRAVPTGEVSFVDAEGYILAAGGPGGVSERSERQPSGFDGKGLQRMMSGMVQGSRLGVAFMGLGIMRRSFLESAIYAAHRRAFSNRIDAFPMVRETLVRMVMELEAAAALTFEAAVCRERGEASLWRILPTLAKYRATRRGVQLASAAVEIHGGNGYIEDWPVARQLRDAQCHTIWEGTENIIALDVLRALERDGALEPLLARVERAIADATDPAITDVATSVRDFATEAREAIAYVASAPKDVSRLHARRVARYLADLASAALLIEQAVRELADGCARKAAVARLYAGVRLERHPLRGIGRDDRIVLDLFEPITRYGAVEPDRLLALAR